MREFANIFEGELLPSSFDFPFFISDLSSSFAIPFQVTNPLCVYSRPGQPHSHSSITQLDFSSLSFPLNPSFQPSHQTLNDSSIQLQALNPLSFPLIPSFSFLFNLDHSLSTLAILLLLATLPRFTNHHKFIILKGFFNGTPLPTSYT